MTEISPTNYRDIKFTRDTKVDYQKGNAIINTIFKKYDKDLSGDLNNEEWIEYNSDIYKKSQIQKIITYVNNNATKYYGSKLANLVDKYNAIQTKAMEVDCTFFDKLLQFEEAHQIQREGYINENLPNEAYEFDASALGMGIYDEEKGYFTGECYQKGYILGLDKLSDAEKKEYLELLENACKVALDGQAIDKECEQLDDEITKYMILLNYAECGYIKGAVSEEKAQKLIDIYNEANPFYKEIKDLEQKKQQFWLKGNKTEEDIRLLDQYDIQLRKLREASSTWSISEADTNIVSQLEREGFSSQLTLLQLTYQNEKLTNTTSGSFNYHNDNWNISGEFSNTVGVDKNCDFHHEYLANLDTRYYWDKLMLKSFSSINSQEGMRTIEQNFAVDYGNFNAGVGENIVTLNNEDTNVTTFTTNANIGFNKGNFSANASASVTPKNITQVNDLGEEIDERFVDYSINGEVSYKTGIVTNSAFVNLNRDSKNYALSSRVEYNKNFATNWDFSTKSSFTSRYNSTLSSFNLSPNAEVTMRYKNEDLSTSLTLQEQYSVDLAKEIKPVTIHNFTANGGVAFKGFEGNIMFNDSDSPNAHTNTYGLNVSYGSDKYGRFGLESSYQKTRNKMTSNTDNNFMISAKYTLTF